MKTIGSIKILDVEVPGWERVIHAIDETTDLDCWIAIHSTVLGPALGGTRFWKYDSPEAAKIDALRLSEGMTLKNSLAGLDLGGGKAVINLDVLNGEKTPDLLHAYAKVLNYLDGAYITAEDVGCTVDDMMIVAESSHHVASVKGCGDPSYATAYGVVRAWQACAQYVRVHKMDSGWPTPPDRNFRSLEGVSVTIQGIGHVGSCLARMAHELGMKVTVTDLDKSRFNTLYEAGIPVKWIYPNELFQSSSNIFAPCALGSVINTESIETMYYDVICGSANNQLEHAHTGYALMWKHITYAPDYIVNAGGITNVFREFGDVDNDFEIAVKLDKVFDRTYSCLEQARANSTPTNMQADKMAMVRVNGARKDTGMVPLAERDAWSEDEMEEWISSKADEPAPYDENMAALVS